MPSDSSRSLDRTTIHTIASAALQSNQVGVEKLHGYLYPTYRLTTSRGSFSILKTRPSSSIRLLRHETDRILSEATALHLLSSHSETISPGLRDYHAASTAPDSCYLISGPFTGAILTDVKTSLSRSDVGCIGRSLGQYLRRLSALSGPAFGPLRQSQTSLSSSQSWAQTYATLLETVLRDGEDALVSLPYECIRDVVRRHRAPLDRIRVPKLMILDPVNDKNVVIAPKTCTVTGLLDFSTAFWGDPLMSGCFYKPTASFLDGFARPLGESNEERIRQNL